MVSLGLRGPGRPCYAGLNKVINPKYKVGDLVNVLLEEPRTMNDKKQPTKNFRMGDLRLEKKKRKILKVLYYSIEQQFCCGFKKILKLLASALAHGVQVKIYSGKHFNTKNINL